MLVSNQIFTIAVALLTHRALLKLRGIARFEDEEQQDAPPG
jgi:hypothetical protein